MSDQKQMAADRFSNGAVSLVTLPRPRDGDWVEVPNAQQIMKASHPLRAYSYPPNNLFAIIAIEFVDDGKVDGPEYHLSISHPVSPGVARRCDRNAARWVLRQFGLDGAKEDNHVPGGQVRNYWRPVADAMVGRECPCVEDEPMIVEDRGDFVWRGTSP